MIQATCFTNLDEFMTMNDFLRRQAEDMVSDAMDDLRCEERCVCDDLDPLGRMDPDYGSDEEDMP